MLIHHSSKGNQSGKSVTDTGAGAGSMSRATDAHLVIRNHAEEGLHVLDAAVRSWAPVPSMSIRFEFPLWYPDGTAPQLDVPKSPATAKHEQQRTEDIVTICDAFKSGKPFGWVDVQKVIGGGESRSTNVILAAVKKGKAEQHKRMKRKHAKKSTMTYKIVTTTGNDNDNDNVPVSVPVGATTTTTHTAYK